MVVISLVVMLLISVTMVMSKATSNSSVNIMLKELEGHYIEDVMNEQESEFYESLTIQLQRGRKLQETDIDKLTEIYQRYCS
jgi:hypothetical protein